MDESTTELSFSGGGMKGISYCGVLKFLEEESVLARVKHLSGTSIGSFFALVVVIGYTSEELTKLALYMDMTKLVDIDLSHFLAGYGLSRSRRVDTLLGYLLRRKGFSDSITFAQLYTFTGVKLSFLCCKLNDFSEVVFNHLTTPEQRVSEACKISMSIPLLFESNRIGGDYVVDGYLYRNIPLHLHSTGNCVGFYLLTPDINTRIESLWDYIAQLYRCMFKKSQSLELDNYAALGYKLVHIDNPSLSDLSPETRLGMITNAYTTCRRAFSKD